MRPQLRIQGTNIVIRGAFNPAIFHPSWLATQGLIRSQEADAAEIEIVHPQVAQFSAEWLRMVVMMDRFQVATTQEPYYEPLRDLVVGIFDLLRHTPLKVVGINRDFHYELQSESAWHGVGHQLAPKEHWLAVLSGPRMKSLTMQGKRPDDFKGYILVKVEPSVRVDFGVYVSINDHYELPSASESPASAEEAIKILSEQWMDSMQRGLQIAERIVSLGETDERSQ
jgi:hypothetical protein